MHPSPWMKRDVYCLIHPEEADSNGVVQAEEADPVSSFGSKEKMGLFLILTGY